MTAGDARPMRDTAFRAELGERACLELMTRADWRLAIEIWDSQQRSTGPQPAGREPGKEPR